MYKNSLADSCYALICFSIRFDASYLDQFNKVVSPMITHK